MPIKEVNVLDKKGRVVETTFAETEPHSIEVSQNAKGQFSITIKMYFGDDGESDIVSRSKKIYDQYVETYKPKLEE
jgi:hypothetical protein